MESTKLNMKHTLLVATSNLNTIMLNRPKIVENRFKLFNSCIHRQIWYKYGMSLSWTCTIIDIRRNKLGMKREVCITSQIEHHSRYQ